MKLKFCAASVIMATMVGVIPLHGHFQTLIPSQTICEDQAETTIMLDLAFCHPFEGEMMNMEKPVRFGVLIKGDSRVDLLGTLKKNGVAGCSAWRAAYTLGSPGDHVFYVEPKAYWEPAEETYILHYTKVVVSSFSMEVGWDAEVGLKTEILPLTRPYGLYTGNVFQGIVHIDGKPVPYCEVEVEYLNNDETYTAPAGPYVTQVVMTDANGVFTYAMPVAGWWGFAALNEGDEPMHNPEDGKDYPVEIGALFWVYVTDME